MKKVRPLLYITGEAAEAQRSRDLPMVTPFIRGVAETGPLGQESSSLERRPTRMYWNSSTGDSDRGDSGEGSAAPLRLLCFLVIRSSLFRMATTTLSSLLWCVLMAYRWQPGKGDKRCPSRDERWGPGQPGNTQEPWK